MESLSIETSDLKNNPVRVIKLKNIMKELTCVLEVNEIEMNIECWGSRINRKVIKTSSSDHLRYNRFRQNLKIDNFIHSMLKALSDNID